MQTSFTSPTVAHGAAFQRMPALRVRQDPHQPQRLRLSGSFGEVCRALDALTQSERAAQAQPTQFGLLTH